jgi:hypothetical protein
MCGLLKVDDSVSVRLVGLPALTRIGDHMLFSIMTAEPNGVVQPVHEKAMPVMLMTPRDVEQWLTGGSLDDAASALRSEWRAQFGFRAAGCSVRLHSIAVGLFTGAFVFRLAAIAIFDAPSNSSSRTSELVTSLRLAPSESIVS